MDQTTEDLETWLQGLKEEAAPFIHTDIPTNEYQPEIHANEYREETAPQKTHHHYTENKKNTLEAYLQTSLIANTLPDPSLLVLNGYLNEEDGERLVYSLLPEHYQKSAGGFYLKAYGKGFAINPGFHFLEKLHQKGVTVQDIDFVIVTSGNAEDFAEAVSLYELNYKCNMLNDKLHIIRYYLHKQAYKTLLGTLKPRFKQEKDTVSALELYEDSPEVESVILTDKVTLNYAQSSATSLSITLEIKKSHSIGWLTGDDATILEKVSELDVLFLSNPEQHTHLKSLSKKPLIFTFGQEKGEGDIRLESVRKLRQELKTNSILPSDRDLLLHLEDLSIECGVCKQATPSDWVHVVKSKKSFGKILYLCPSCCL